MALRRLTRALALAFGLATAAAGGAVVGVLMADPAPRVVAPGVAMMRLPAPSETQPVERLASTDLTVAGVARPADTVAAAVPAWRRYAVAAPATTRPMIALIIDDMGVAREWSRQAVALPAPLTLSYLPYADDLGRQTEAARRAGHELFLHLPMEPDNPDLDTGPNALLTELDTDELRRRLTWSLDRFTRYVGVNNHMGSRFTRDPAMMGLVLDALKRRGLAFVDSLTTPASVGVRLARLVGVPVVGRDVFIDNQPDVEKIMVQLEGLEALALTRGYAVGVGHPRPATLTVLADWLPTLRARGFALVPVSAILARVTGVATAAVAATEPKAGAAP